MKSKQKSNVPMIIANVLIFALVLLAFIGAVDGPNPPNEVPVKSQQK